MYKYPVSRPYLGEKERQYLLAAFDSSWISSKGEYLDKFEEAIATKIETAYALATSSGTTALHLAMIGCGIKPGDEVITTVLSYVATANAISYVGAKPVFVDVEPDTWNLSLDAVVKATTEKTKAILVVHLYGTPCDRQIFAFAKAHNIKVIEDAAESFGSYYADKAQTGSLGDVGCFSFFANKNLACGEGGALVCNDKDIFKICKKFRGQGLTEGTNYWHDVIGYNYRLTNLQAAIGLAQIENFEFIQKRKNEIHSRYKKNFKDLINKNFVSFQNTGVYFSNYWMTNILVYSIERDELMRKLGLMEIETRPMFYPIVDFKMYKEDGGYPNARQVSDRGITLPSYVGLSDADVDDISEKVVKCVMHQ